ncbi:MAG: ribonuclease P protein component [Patescibacteria group bacterium]|nr:ribonuclease P protein component [Patescibacteria group bacterium]MDE1945751.1 ribonuclease P protein component [Patescibacteria group bacterium]
MMPKRKRPSRAEIEQTIKTGRTAPGEFVYAKISRESGISPLFAVVVSKKTEKTSVGRHRIKRRISAAAEKTLKTMPDFKKTMVFFAKKSDAVTTYADIEKDVGAIFRSAAR